MALLGCDDGTREDFCAFRGYGPRYAEMAANVVRFRQSVNLRFSTLFPFAPYIEIACHLEQHHVRLVIGMVAATRPATSTRIGLLPRQFALFAYSRSLPKMAL
jgi:hypothetical protein